MPSWMKRIQEQTPGFEQEVVQRCTHGLIALARRKLPKQLQARIDPEDVVQSVYRSFFRRLQDGQFQFDEAEDLWRLLAAMTFRKAINVRKHHLRLRRDARREAASTGDDDAPTTIEQLAQPEEGDVDFLMESLDHLLQGLPEICREVVVLRLQGYTIDETAAQVKRSRRTVLRVLACISESGSAEAPAA